MLYYIIIFATTFCGAQALCLLDTGNSWFSLRMLFGFIAPVLTLFFANVLLQAPLSTIAVFYLAIVTLAFTTVSFMETKLVTNSLRNSLTHPAFLLPASSFLIFSIFGFSKFEPHAWDEFSHWVTMPRQMFTIDQLASELFSFKRFIPYPPGWPISLIYPLLVMKTLWGLGWSSHHLVYAPFLLGLISVSLIYDCLKSLSFKNRWLFFLSILVFALPVILQTNVLVETPQIFVILSIFLTLWAGTKDLMSAHKTLLICSFLLAYGYLLKDSFVVVLLPLIFFAAQRRILNVNMLLQLISPLVFVALAWKLHTKAYLPVFELTTSRNFMEIWGERSSVLPKMLIGLLKLPRGIDYFLLPLTIYCLVKAKSERFLYKLIAIYGAGVFIGLYWLYMNSFKVYEALALASFQRYFTPFMKVGGILTLMVFASFLICNGFEKKLRLKISPIILNALIGITLITLILNISFNYTSVLRNMPKDPVVREGETLALLLNQKGRPQQNIFVISQNSDSFEYYKAIYTGFLGDHSVYIPSGSVSWGKPGAKSNLWMEEIQPSKLIESFSQSDALWVIKTNSWMDGILIQFLNGKKCHGTFENYFLIKSSTGKFECILKQPGIDPVGKEGYS